MKLPITEQILSCLWLLKLQQPLIIRLPDSKSKGPLS